jgi:molybdopterin molybdotransferase
MTIQNAIAAPGCGCDGPGARVGLIGIDDALGRIAETAGPLNGEEEVALAHATGRVLAHPVRSRAMAPPFDNAAMDGYAVVTAALPGDGPWVLPVVARIPAGQAGASRVTGAVAVRIFTGAPVPAGADAVVMQEDVIRDGEHICVARRPKPGQNIRRAGEDMMAGATVLERGCRLGPRQIAGCAAAGAGRVHVRSRPRVALIVTGNEVQAAGTDRSDAQIWDINTPMLSAALSGAGLMSVAVERGADNRTSLARQVADMAARADLVVTTGGISVGEEDHVKSALIDAGGTVLFSGVAIKPGKPVSFGRIGSAFWLGLPGNPLSAFVTWQVFGTALVRALSGENGACPARRHVVTATPIRRKPGRCELRPARLAGFDSQGRDVVTFDAATQSGRVGSLVYADGLIYLPSDIDVLRAGALVEFQPFCLT